MDRENKAYKNVLKHRLNCKKWGKEFCLDCFGGGLNRFVDDYDKEMNLSLGLPTPEEIVKRHLDFENKLKEIKKLEIKHGKTN